MSIVGCRSNTTQLTKVAVVYSRGRDKCPGFNDVAQAGSIGENRWADVSTTKAMEWRSFAMNSRPHPPSPPPPPPPPAPPLRPLCSFLPGNVSFRAAAVPFLFRDGAGGRPLRFLHAGATGSRCGRTSSPRRDVVVDRIDTSKQPAICKRLGVRECGHTAGRKKEGGRAVGWQWDREIKRKEEKERVSQDAPPATDCTLVAFRAQACTCVVRFCVLTLSRYLGGVAWSSSLRGYIPTVPPLPPLPPPPPPTTSTPSARHPSDARGGAPRRTTADERGGRGRRVSKKEEEEEVREDDDEGDNGDDDEENGGAPAVEGERRHIRRELLRWTKNMVFVVENTLVVETCCEETVTPPRRQDSSPFEGVSYTCYAHVAHRPVIGLGAPKFRYRECRAKRDERRAVIVTHSVIPVVGLHARNRAISIAGCRREDMELDVMKPLPPRCPAFRVASVPFPKRFGKQGKATQCKARQGRREQGGGRWAQLLLIVKRHIKKGEEKALGGWEWVTGGQRKRREK
ncbi:hypothetical protein ALC60_10676 [Trachymyrmex zeteki]|uniref:Uncharacterized protein n=1 Tax=Mycetomoellerius zeteki TaxID=64791 RepID=A0A151WQN9_9HYME|nr:hypothetical protein ALC60_10676 [Trachymyrmex zeteki]